MGLICDQVSWLGLCMKVGRGLTLYGASGPKLRFQAIEYCDVDDQLASDPSKLYSGVAYFWGSFLDTSSLATGYSRRSIDTWTFAPTVVSARQGVIYLSALQGSGLGIAVNDVLAGGCRSL